MSARRHLQRFLSAYDSNSAIHRRVLKMLMENLVESGEQADVTDLLPPGEGEHSLIEQPPQQTPGHVVEDIAFDESRAVTPLDRPETVEPAITPSQRVLETPPMEADEDSRIKRPRLDEAEAYDIPGLAGYVPEEPVPAPVTKPPAPQRRSQPVSREAQSRAEAADKTGTSQRITKGPWAEPPVCMDPSYLFPELQCKLCGLRYHSKETEAFGTHIEDHRRRTRALDDKTFIRREFFSSVQKKAAARLMLAQEEERPEAMVWRGSSPTCSVCGGSVKRAWNDELEEWVLDGGVKLSENEVVHRTCVL